MHGTVVHELSNEIREEAWDVWCEVFLAPECFEFAIAANRLTGLPIVGIRHNDTIWHACVKVSDGMYFDARGFVPYRDLGAPFSVPQPLMLADCTEDDLAAVRKAHQSEINSFSIERALRVIEFLWGDRLPVEDPVHARARAFLEELAELCGKHGFWIRAPFPGAKPVLEEQKGGEAGYVAEPHIFLSFTIDRVLDPAR